MQVRAWVELHPSLDAASWRQMHARGAVPDRLPYGLDRLAGYGLDVDVRADRRGTLGAAGYRMARRLGGSYAWAEALAVRTPPEADVALSWDERRGAPRAMAEGRRRSVGTGVIWLTESRPGPADRAALRALRRCSLVWVLAAPQLDLLREQGIARSRLAHLPFGVDADFFDADAGVPTTDLVVSAGNDRHRDWGTLLDAFALVRQVRPTARLELATRTHVPPAAGVTVHASLGHAALRRLYSRAAVVAVSTHPNLHVSGMTVALEAKAMRRPVVMSRTAGVGTYVEHDVDGVLVPPGSPRAMAEAIIAVLSDEAVAAALGAAGRASVEAHLSTEAQARRLAELVETHC